MKPLFCISLFLCPYLSSAQSLTIGQRLPPNALHILQNTASLSGYPRHAATINPQLSSHNPQPLPSPRLYLLDFWATWCSSCLKTFPTLQQLQHSFGSQLQVVLINSRRNNDTPEKISAFFKKHKATGGGAYHFSSLQADTLFGTLFPHQAIPHFVWIDSSGTVKAITGSADVTSTNISRLLAGQPLSLADRSVFARFNPLHSFFLPAAPNDSLAAVAYAGLSTEPPPYFSKFYEPRTASWQRFLAIQKPLLYIYRQLFQFSANRLKIQLPATHPALTSLYNAEITLPSAVPRQQLSQQLLSMLNHRLGLASGIAILETSCYAIVTTDSCWRLQQPLAVQEGMAGYVNFINRPMSHFIEALNSPVLKDSLLPVIIDESGISAPVSLSIPVAALKGNLHLLQEALHMYGLQLVPVTRRLPFFVVRAAASINQN